MDLVMGKPFFPIGFKTKQYPYLVDDIETEVCIIGGGVTGALALWYFTQKGIRCALIDSERFGMRSTSITTALLQYELDSNYSDLKKQTSPSDVEEGYKLGVDSLHELENIIQKIGNECDYDKTDCLLFTTKESEILALKKEYDARVAMGLDVSFYTQNNNPYPFGIKAGVHAKNGGARFNPYVFTHQLLSACESQNALHENTKAIKLEYKDDLVKITTQYQNIIKARAVVVATGYELEPFTKKEFCKKYITYNIVTKPVNEIDDLKLVIRDNQTKYHYIRQTRDKRFIIGGEDVLFSMLGKSKKTAERKYEKLLEYIKELFPDYKEHFEIETAYCGAFGTTKDNLGVIGQDKNHKNLYYCLGYGANGIMFSIIGAKMLVEKYTGGFPDRIKLFSPSRKTI